MKVKGRKLRIHRATLNCRGLLKPAKKTQIADIMAKYNIKMMAIQETHIVENDTEHITRSDHKNHSTIFCSVLDMGAIEGQE